MYVHKDEEQRLLVGLQEPKYRTVYNQIVDSTSDGSLKLGVRLPSKNELSQRFQSSRQTVRRAIDLLEQQKLMTRVRRSGTYMDGESRLGRQERYMNTVVINTYVGSYISPTVLREIESVLPQRGYMTQIVFTGNRIGRKQEILSNLTDKDMIDGLIVEPAESTLLNPSLCCYKELMNRHIPILFFNRMYPELGLPFVVMDNVNAGRKAMEYLVKAGHKKIGGIFECDGGQGPLCYKGFMQGMEETDLRTKDRNVVWIDSGDMVEIEHQSGYLFRRIGDCTAVVCYNDEVAYILSGICEKRGISILDQLSLMDIGDSEFSTLAEMPIISLPYPMEELGRKMAESIVKMVGNPCLDGNYHFDPDVIGWDSAKLIKDDDAKQ